MKEIRATVEHIKSSKGYNSFSYQEIKHIVNLAEKVLAVKGLPEKKKHSDWDCGDTHCIVCEDRGYNQALDDCRIAITGALLSVKELDRLIQENGYKTIEHMALAIHSAQMEKLGGVR